MSKDKEECEEHMEEFRKECNTECVALAKVATYNKFISALLITLLGANGFVLLKYADTATRIVTMETNAYTADKVLNDRLNAQRDDLKYIMDRLQKHEIDDAEKFHKARMK